MSTGRIAVGHPVDVGSGMVYTAWNDFILPGGVSVAWRRYYSTASAYDGWHGRGWAAPYFMTLDRTTDGFLLTDEQGGRLLFPAADDLRDGRAVRLLGANMELRREDRRLVVTHWHHGADHVERFVFAPAAAGPMRLSALETLPGFRLSIGYDPRGRPAALRQELEGRVVELAYNGRDLIERIFVTAASGERRELARYEYDAQRRLILAAGPSGAPTVYRYDAAHRMVSETSPHGSTFTFEYDRQGRCVRTSGDDGHLARRLEYSTVPHRTRVTDGQGNRTDYYLNPAGQVVQEVPADGAVVTREFDEHGRPVRVMFPDGDTLGYQYDDRGNQTGVAFGDGVQVGGTFDDRHLLLSYTDAGGGTWAYERDAAGHPVAFVDPLGQRRTAAWNSAGLLVESRTAVGTVTRRQYGPGMRWVEVSDDLGLIAREEFDPLGSRVAVYDAEGLVRRIQYDSAGQVAEVTDSIGRVYRYAWTAVGAPREYTGPGGEWVRWQYNRFGEVVAHHNPLGVMRLEYDTENRLTAVVNRAGERLERRYDVAGRLVEEVGFDGGTEAYEYNPRGKLVRAVHGDGRSVTFKYAKSGYLQSRTSSDGTVEEFAFDPGGRLLSATNADAVVEWEWDPLGRLVAESQNGRRVECEFDADSRRVARRLPGATAGGAVTMAYNVRNRMTHLGDEAGVFQELRWDPLSRLSERRSAGGVVERYAYDAARRLREQQVSSPAEPTPIVRRYEYDVRGNVAVRADSRRGGTAFRYDAADRLVGADGPAGREAYDYDPNGTIRSTHRGPRTVAAGGRTLADGTRQFDYNGDGAVTAIRGPGADLELEHNVRGQITLARRPDGTEVRYAYDALGRRVRKEADGVRTEFLWQGINLAAELRDGAVTDVYFHLDGEPVAQWRGADRLTPVTDERQALQEVFGPDGGLAWAGTLDAYGNVTAQTGPSPSPGRFRGQYFDRETGFHYNFHRTYDPALGNYLTRDPIGLLGGANYYAYPRNPLLWDDPLGLACPAHKAEEEMDKHMADRGYTRVDDTSKKLTAPGIDGVYKLTDPSKAPPGVPPPLYVIGEAKSGSATLGNTKMSGGQLGDKWIDTPIGRGSTPRLEKSLNPPGTTSAADIRTAAGNPSEGVSKMVFSSANPGGTGNKPTITQKPYTPYDPSKPGQDQF